jgi:hypothetical protein
MPNSRLRRPMPDVDSEIIPAYPEKKFDCLEIGVPR